MSANPKPSDLVFGDLRLQPLKECFTGGAQISLDHAQLASIQARYQPDNLFQRIGLLEIAAKLNPAAGEPVTGDFYKINRIGRDRILIIWGDAEMHGFAAARQSNFLHLALQESAALAVMKSSSPNQILEYIDRNYSLGPNGMPLACMVIEPSLCRITYAGAGMPMAPVLREGRGVDRLEFGGLMIGAGYSTFNQGDSQKTLEPNDTLLLISDGLLEAKGCTTNQRPMWSCILDDLSEISLDTKSPLRVVNQIHDAADDMGDDMLALAVKMPFLKLS